FFKVTRELIKAIPANKIRSSESTKRLVNVAVAVLNDALRPHLTTWQGRYRRWYEREQAKEGFIDMEPQELQKRFPRYEELSQDLLKVNARLIKYREVLHAIALENKA